MTYWITSFTIAVLLGGLFLFIVGQYNALVSMRHRIATVVLEIDFLLQQQAADLEGNAHMTLEDGTMTELRGARAASHKAASNPFKQGALEALSNARETLMQACLVTGFIGMSELQKDQLVKATLKLQGLSAHYRGMLKKNPASWIARHMFDA